jgi:hypothetical protein
MTLVVNALAAGRILNPKVAGSQILDAAPALGTRPDDEVHR